MADKQKKANGIVEGALSTFTKAISKVEKANELLGKAVTEDESKMQKLTEEIENKYAELDYIQSGKIKKMAEINSNKDLIQKLSRFIK